VCDEREEYIKVVEEVVPRWVKKNPIPSFFCLGYQIEKTNPKRGRGPLPFELHLSFCINPTRSSFVVITTVKLFYTTRISVRKRSLSLFFFVFLIASSFFRLWRRDRFVPKVVGGGVPSLKHYASSRSLSLLISLESNRIETLLFANEETLFSFLE